MVKYKEYIFLLLILFFLLFSFSPTLFELSKSTQLKDPNREFILEHNYYWPDFNLYLSKVRQGYEGRLTALERYTSEPHQGSLIQEFYVILGFIGKILNIDPNFAYQLGRVILSPLLLFMIMILSIRYFSSWRWQILAFLIVVVSGSFPRFYTDQQGILHIGRFMEWWSNIDALQRITFIPHILFGQVVSFYLLYQLTPKNAYLTSEASSLAPVRSASTGQAIKKLILYILLGNLVGLVFPPSLIILNGVIFLTMLISYIRSKIKNPCLAGRQERSKPNVKLKVYNFKLGFDQVRLGFDFCTLRFAFCLFSLPSLLYLFFITKSLPWSSLVDFHRTHPMMIPFGEYIKGTGPIFYLGLAGAVLSIIKRDRKFRPLILWLVVTFFFAILFTHIKEQSPLRFTQTGLFIPLGILGTYFFQQIWNLNYLPLQRFLKFLLPSGKGGETDAMSEGSPRIPEVREIRKPARAALSFSHFFERPKKWEIIKIIISCVLGLYIAGNLYMMKISLDWQISWITQRIGANIPLVPDPPQTMYPLKNWMDGIRWLGSHADHNKDVVLAEITAGNYIPAYAGNTVYFGQANTVDYEKKQQLVDRFYKGEMDPQEAKSFLIQGKVKYIFASIQEKEMATDKDISKIYNFLLPIYNNSMVNIYTLRN